MDDSYSDYSSGDEFVFTDSTYTSSSDSDEPNTCKKYTLQNSGINGGKRNRSGDGIYSNKKSEIRCNSDVPPMSTKHKETQRTSQDSEFWNEQKFYQCNHRNCNSVFYKLGRLKEHYNTHDDLRPYLCKELKCSKAYFSWMHLRKHLIKHHQMDGVKKTEYMSEEKDSQNTHKCPYEGCTSEFSRPWRLRAHMSVHTNKKLYSCSENGCNKMYTTLGHLQRHTATIHKPKKHFTEEYLCTEKECQKVYRSVESLRRHYKLHHSENKKVKEQYKCSYCDGCFRTQNRLLQHQFIHTNVPQFKCSDCSKSFTDVSLWKRHKKSHKTFVCDASGCTEVFPQYVLLMKHKKNEHPKSHSCQICDKIFSSKASLHSHVQTHLPHNERKLFPCPYDECTRSYTRGSYLDAHIERNHEDKKLLCSFPGCGKRLITKQKLHEHMAKIHDPLRPPPVHKQIARRKRKDAGLPKRSAAAKLSGVNVPYEMEKKILQNDTELLKIHTNMGTDAEESPECKKSKEYKKSQNVLEYTEVQSINAQHGNKSLVLPPKCTKLDANVIEEIRNGEESLECKGDQENNKSENIILCAQEVRVGEQSTTDRTLPSQNCSLC